MTVVASGLRKLHGHRARINKGQALAEFVLIVPIMLLLLLAAIDFGRLFASYVQLTNGAREGAVYGAGNPTNTAEIATHAGYEANSQTQLGQGALAITAACADSSGHPLACSSAAGGGGIGNTITVTAKERFTFLTPFIGDLFGGGITINSSTTAVVLNLAASGGGGSNSCKTNPTASFTVSVSGNTVTLDASGSSPTTGVCAISGYNWDMGDGANPYPPVVNRNVSYTYAINGTYTILLQVTGPGGEAQTFQSVTIGPGPTASPTPTPPPTPPPTSQASPPPTCNTVPSFTATFTGNGNGVKKDEMTFYGGYTGQPVPASWTWNFGDNSADSGQTVSNNYKDAGKYTVTLTVKNGTCSKSFSEQVTVP